MKIPKVYYAHAMEQLKIPEESGRRGRSAKELLGKDFEVLLPEDWQENLTRETILDIDLSKLDSADIVIGDLWHQGREINGKFVQAQGTLMELGYAMAKRKFIVIISRFTKEHHPFHFGAHKIVHSLDEACEYIKETYKG